MPAPNEQDVEALRIRLCEAIDVGIMEPLAAVDAVETLTDLCRFAPARAAELLAQIRQHAANANWNREDINRISFRAFEQEARLRNRAEEATRRTVVQAAERFTAGGRNRRNRPTGPPTDIPHGELTPEQMLDTDSPYLVVKGHLLSRRRARIWYDTFYKKYMMDWAGSHDDSVVPAFARTDETDRKVFLWLQQIDPRLSKLSESQVSMVMSNIGDLDKRNEVKDWLDNLRWDGEDRVAQLMSRAYGTPDDEYHRSAGRNWMISMAARIREPGVKVDTMPVFAGGQGALKSQSLEVIGGQWYSAAASSIDSKDFLQELNGVLVLEIPELHSMVASRHGAAKIKAVLSTRVDRYRLPYGRHVLEFKRTAVIAGTTNNRDWHTDETGGRRFWPIHVGQQIDLEWLRANRDQLFAEAAQLLTAGATWWEMPEDEQARRVEAERAIDPWEDIIGGKLYGSDIYTGFDGDGGPEPRLWDGTFSDSADWGTVVTTQRVGIQWLRMTPEILGRNSRRIGAILRTLGWEPAVRRINSGHTTRLWVLRPGVSPSGTSSSAEAEIEVPEYQRTTPDVDDDIPF